MTKTEQPATKVGDHFIYSTDALYDRGRQTHRMVYEIVVISVDPVGFKWETVRQLVNENPPTAFQPMNISGGSIAHFAIDHYLANGKLTVA